MDRPLISYVAFSLDMIVFKKYCFAKSGVNDSFDFGKMVEQQHLMLAIEDNAVRPSISIRNITINSFEAGISDVFLDKFQRF